MKMKGEGLIIALERKLFLARLSDVFMIPRIINNLLQNYKFVKHLLDFTSNYQD